MAAWLLLLCGVGVPLPAQQTAAALVPGASSSFQGGEDRAGATGSVAGVVMDGQGDVMVGAHVTLAGAPDLAPRYTESDIDGRFVFRAAPAGRFTVTAAVQGFDPVRSEGTLRPGQSLEVPPLVLQMATVNFEVDAVVSTEELATEQMHAEVQQRLIGVLPNFFVSYNWAAPPLTTRQKFTLAWKNASDPGNLLLVGTVAGVQQATDAFPGYSQGAKGYGRRYGADLGNLVSGTFMGGAILPWVFHQDPRYFYKGTGSVKSRFLYAISTAVICRGDNGRRQPAFASVLGDLSAGAISNLYYAPSDRQGVRLTFVNGFLGVAGDAMNNVFQEFLLKKLTPKVRDATSNSAPAP